LATRVLTWNPARFPIPDDDLAEMVTTTWKGGYLEETWSVGRFRSGINPGDRGFLLRQKTSRGIIASGTFSSEIFEGDHWDGTPGKTTNYAGIVWDTWLDVDDRLPIDQLLHDVPNVPWNFLLGSGQPLKRAAEPVLEAVWRTHLSEIGWGPALTPEEVGRGEVFAEGSVTQVMVNRYERDPRARDACIARWGVQCSVCGFRFADRYGELGEGYIHVHHLKDLSLVGDNYKVDPVRDLRPVCPNCHAMLHRQQPAMTIKQLKTRLLSSRPSV